MLAPANMAKTGVAMPKSMKSLIRAIIAILPPLIAVRLHYLLHHQRFPNIGRPTRFTEKIMRRKLFDRDRRMPLLADKVAVKSFVSNKLGDDFVIPLIWSGAGLPPIEARDWQIPFVLKSNNGSGTNIFVRNAEECDWPRIEEKCRNWLSSSHASWANE